MKVPASSTDPGRRRFLRGLLGGTLALGTLGGVGVAQAYDFGTVREEGVLPGLRSPLRVAFLTDLHYGLYIFERQIRAWVDTANAAQPDLVLLGGDFLDVRSDVDPAPLLTELARLRAPLGVYAVWGNHDYGSFGAYDRGVLGQGIPGWAERREQVAAAFAAAGITVLRNAGRSVRDDLWVGGVDDLWRGEPDVRAALAGAGEGQASVLLSHNPDLLPDLPQRVGLVLSGHTHGGQIRLPVVGAPVVPSKYGQRYAMGWVQGAHGTPGYVSRGLGVSGVPLRNLCPPEVTLLTLRPE
ncbi:putative MPP superfamily phosphohydrolase [Deinococcus sp. HSC-46F16]|uniref:metallophosphoesterase n=1 Tax=Deinococcus sp. HSC-46F16 TaxID=2910968 RepID=UPI0020A15381|nr:metallophosphoesterase [Deinococcus sp. HSC-46F16]MCP2014260.1 putative MPP superfamily phosphohydrolase [Deinococcus sp. HSC-46F16]